MPLDLSKAKVQSTEPLPPSEAKWTRLVKITYNDPTGKTRTWEAAERTTRPENSLVDGVGIIALLDKPEGKELLLQKQYRPPLDKVVIEVPAGLIDAGESPAECAVRELKEETGYVGTVATDGSGVSSVMFNGLFGHFSHVNEWLGLLILGGWVDPGFCNTNLNMVHIEIDMSEPENQNPKPQLEESEFIEVFSIPLNKLFAECKRLENEGSPVALKMQGPDRLPSPIGANFCQNPFKEKSADFSGFHLMISSTASFIADHPSPAALPIAISFPFTTSPSFYTTMIIDNPKSHLRDEEERRRRLHHEADVVVVGAGIMGCAIAVALGNQGRSVILLEKSLKEPDRIVGELLQPGGVAALERLGLRDCLEGIDAVVVKGYEVIYKGSPVEIPYPKNTSSQKRPEGRSFHHGRFISRLRDAARRTPNVTIFESTATEVIKSDCSDQILGVEARTNNQSDAFFANLTIISDGYSSKFRSTHHRHAPTSRSKFWGLELHDCPLPLPLHGHVLLGQGAPILLYQIGTHETRALIDIPTNTPTASFAAGGVKSHLLNHVLPTLPEAVQPSFHKALTSSSLRSMPNSFLPPTTNKTPGLILLGDALNMRHPLTGGGMTVAFNDVVLLSDLLAPLPSLQPSPQLHSAMRTFHWRRKSLSAVINVLAQALYALFAAGDPQLGALQRGCFEYFQRGGNCVDGPVGLLAGIIRRPLVLIWHFFAVALLSIGILFRGVGVSAWAGKSVESVKVFWTACVVIFPYLLAEVRW
ncbi:MAG: Squalene epoxidase [Vezdaea aestivalis]|nr:MAG: Squalene epoxidase [Vezdaea aestivalis]